MSQPSDPTLFARRYSFAGAECIYRDHRGHRVLADWEGPGRIILETPHPPLEFQPPLDDPMAGHAASGCCVCSPEAGESNLFVLVGPAESFERATRQTPERPGRSAEGCGWVVRAEGLLRVDHRREFAPTPSPETPVPFFLHAEADGLEIVRRSFKAHLIDHFSIDDDEALQARSFRVQNISDRAPLESKFPDGTPHRAIVASHLNTATWTLRVPAGSPALVIRKTFDRFHGRQRARVSVGGRSAGWWYDPVELRSHRWGVSDFLVPSGVCPEGEVEVAIDPVAGSPLWSVSTLEVFSLERL